MIATQTSELEVSQETPLPYQHRLEDRLLLACSSRHMPPASVLRTRKYFDLAMDWDYIAYQAQQHSVLPLVNRNFQLHFPELIPKSTLLFLNEKSRACQIRNLTLTGELLRILGIFQTAGIEAIPFKGPALAIQAYGNISLRMFADLDILLREADLARARDALLDDGYAAEFSFTPEQERNYLKTECALQLRHPGREVVVELHWLLTERYLSINLPMEDFRKRCSALKIGQMTVKALATEDLLLYLCVHGSKHQWERLEWLCSVAEIAIAHPAMDWLAVGERARASGTQRILRTALLLAHTLLAMPLPEVLRADLENDPIAKRLAEHAAVGMFSRQSGSKDQEANRSKWYLSLLRTRERWPDKFRILVYSSVRQPHPDSQELVKLPSRLAFLYYFLRPARLLGTTVWAFLRTAAARKHSKATTPKGLVN